MGGRDVIGPAVALDPPRREGPSTPAKPSTLPRCAASTRALLSKADSCRDGAASLMACRVNWLMSRLGRISDSLVHIWKLAAQRFLRVARILLCERWVVFVCPGSGNLCSIELGARARRFCLYRRPAGCFWPVQKGALCARAILRNARQGPSTCSSNFFGLKIRWLAIGRTSAPEKAGPC